MRRHVPAAVAALTAVAALAAPASAGFTTQIEVVDDDYAPANANIALGQGVHWFVAAPTANEHNVLATGKLFDSGDLVRQRRLHDHALGRDLRLLLRVARHQERTWDGRGA